MAEPKKILIVDDEEEIRENLCDFIEFSGYQVHDASDGTEALEFIKKDKPDLMLSDLMMPRLGGLQLLQETKKQNIEGLPIVIMTAFGTMEYAIEAMKNGAADFITKPIDLEYLKTVLQRVLHLSEMERKVKEHQRQLEEDLQHASRIQQCQLPEPIDTPKLVLHYRYQPLIAIGGDYLTVHHYDENHLMVALYDVVGHGVSAALTASMVHNQLRLLMGQQNSPAAIIKELNQIVTEQVGTTSMFLTGILASIDLKTNQMKACNAGHPEGYLWKQQEASLSPLVSKITPVGLTDNILGDASEIQLDMQSGDRLILYTDGFLESRNQDGEMMGQEKLQNLFTTHSALPAQQFVDKLFEELSDYRGQEPEDDLTLVVVDIK